MNPCNIITSDITSEITQVTHVMSSSYVYTMEGPCEECFGCGKITSKKRQRLLTKTGSGEKVQIVASSLQTGPVPSPAGKAR